MNYRVLKEKELYCLTEVTRLGFVTVSSIAMTNRLTDLSYWGVTTFIDIKGQEIEIEFIYNRPADFRSINGISSMVLVDYLKAHHPEINIQDITGGEWRAGIMARILTKDDVDMLRKEGVSFYSNTYLPGESKEKLETAFHEVEYELAKPINNRPEWLVWN